MQLITVLVLAFLVGISGYLIKVPVDPILLPETIAPAERIHLQKLVIPLFENVCEASTDPVVVKLALEFPASVTASDFWATDSLSEFQNLKSGKGFLPKGQIFTEYNVEHTNELKIIFEVMQNAKTFDTFYKVAAWSRQNSNCGLYVNLIYMALENRRDTGKLTLPPPYELLPNYFIRKDIIIQGSSLLAGEEFTPSEGVRDEGNTYTINANYTANLHENDDESQLSYFREDIGLNSYYFLKMLKFAPWSNRNIDINSRYGEEMYHMMKQLVARYNLERYANGLPEQDNINWNSLPDSPYDPMLVYSNGNEFIHRTSSVQLPENEDKALLHTIENNIATVVSHMRDAGYNKTQVLNHLMEILVTNERSYDALARHLFGRALSNNGQPTIFEHFMTSLRDPMVWKINKKIVDLVDTALNVLPSYTKNELYFPGVEVINVDIKKVITNFDSFEFDITEALKIGNGDTTFQVKIDQPRLNHKPFVMKMNISSLVTQKGLVKVYIAPKIMPGEFAKNKNNFYFLDSFELNLKKGSNIVTRTSGDMKMLATDFMSLKTLRKKVEDAQFGLDSLPLSTVDSQINFPERLSIPKGTLEGLPLQLLVFVAPVMKATVVGAWNTPSFEFNPAVISSLYPLDLMMEDRILLDLPNAFLKDFTVTHKGASSTKKEWNDKKYDPSTRPNTYTGKNEPFDYKYKQLEKDDVENINAELNKPNENYYFQVPRNDDSELEVKKLLLSPNDYSVRSNQPYDYKAKRPSYQKPDYLSNKVDYKSLYQKTTTTESPENFLSEKNNSIVASSNENQTDDQTEKNDIAKYDANTDVDELNGNMQNDDSALEMKRQLLKFSAYEYDKNDDMKKIHPKFIVPNYKKIHKNAWKTTETPSHELKKTTLQKTNENMNEQIIVDPNFEPNEYIFYKITPENRNKMERYPINEQTNHESNENYNIEKFRNFMRELY